VLPIVKPGRFRKPDWHGAEKVQMAEEKIQRSEDRRQKAEVRRRMIETIVVLMLHPLVSEFGIRIAEKRKILTYGALFRLAYAFCSAPSFETTFKKVSFRSDRSFFIRRLGLHPTSDAFLHLPVGNNIFDQLQIADRIDIDGCFRVG